MRNATAVVLLAVLAQSLGAQEVVRRNYDANFTTVVPTIDGVVSPGEWSDASTPAGAWTELRDGDADSDGNRFQVLWDDENMYILHMSDYTNGSDFDEWLIPFDDSFPQIVFSEENLNLYIDPNRDGDLNTSFSQESLTTAAADRSNSDGYQFGFNQYEGRFVSTSDDFQGIGFFTEAHVNTLFGDQGNWNRLGHGQGGSSVGAAMIGRDIVVAQTNTNAPGPGEPSSVVEIVIPFADLDAEEFIPGQNVDYGGNGLHDLSDYTVWRDALGASVGGAEDGVLQGADGDDDGAVTIDDYYLWAEGFGGDAGFVPTGLNATDSGRRSGPRDGEVWGFNVAAITRDGDAGENYLPIWSWHDDRLFAAWPHGTLTFRGPLPDVGIDVPEQGATTIGGIAVLFGVIGASRRQRVATRKVGEPFLR